MGAFNQLQGQGVGMAKDLSKTSDDLVSKVQCIVYGMINCKKMMKYK